MRDPVPRRYWVGWDVGAWHCDKNAKSRDALCVLTEGPTGNPAIQGQIWRGNIREQLATFGGYELVTRVLELCDVTPSKDIANEITIAIDAPLGWPIGLSNLIESRPLIPAPDSDRNNRFTRRRTEIWLIENGTANRPLSSVRDMIGSQSSKAMFFVQKTGLPLSEPGIWTGRFGNDNVIAIETYPAAAKGNQPFANELAAMIDSEAFRGAVSGHKTSRPDEEDALCCALVARHFARGEFQRPPAEYEREVSAEGWIILPT